MARKQRRQRAPADRSPGEIAPPPPGSPQNGGRVLIGSVLAVLLVLATTGDDRHVGLIADGRQMIRTAVAVVETGGIGQAVGRDFTVERPAGDAVSRFGMATSLLQVPAAWLAPRIEGARGPGSSQALFLLVPWLAVGVAAAAAGALARRLGAGNLEVGAAVLLASIASPLGAYGLLEFSEPVQAAALTVALWAALCAAQAPKESRALGFLAGLAAGVAVLTKSSLLAAAPFTLLPLLDPGHPGRSRRDLGRAAAGAMGPIFLWGLFEITRFGRLLGGYPDDRFTHPWLDGLWRLLIGPNRGMLLFWPALLLFAGAGLRWRGEWFKTPAARAWLGAALVLAAQVAVAAGYWGWHGMEGWGPRLVVSAVPLMAPFAAMGLGPRRPFLLAGVVAVSFAINLPPLLQHPTPVATYVMNLAWPEVGEKEADRFPYYARSVSPAGRPTVVPFESLELEAAANPWRLYLWFWRTSHLGGPPLADALEQPPWHEARPDLAPSAPWSPEAARQVAPVPRFGYLGRSLTGGGGPYATVYLDALLDQIVRAHQGNQIEMALELSEQRLRLESDGEAAAWRLESLRRAGRAGEAEALLRSLPEDARIHPLVNVVLALFDREAGVEPRARALLKSVAGAFPRTRLQEALAAPLSDWPDTLDGMTRAARRDAAVTGPR